MRNKRGGIITFAIIIIILLVIGFVYFLSQMGIETKVDVDFERKQEENNTQVANPASTNCLDKGHKLELRQNEEGVYGVCIDSVENECEEWEYFREECTLEENIEES